MQMHPNVPHALFCGAGVGMVLSMVAHGVAKQYAYELLHDPASMIGLGLAAGAVTIAVGLLASLRVRNFRWKDRWILGLTGGSVCLVLFTFLYPH